MAEQRTCLAEVGAGEGFEPPTSGLWALRATELLYPASTPEGTRTLVSAVKGRDPRPLDDRGWWGS